MSDDDTGTGGTAGMDCACVDAGNANSIITAQMAKKNRIITKTFNARTISIAQRPEKNGHDRLQMIKRLQFVHQAFRVIRFGQNCFLAAGVTI